VRMRVRAMAACHRGGAYAQAPMHRVPKEAGGAQKLVSGVWRHDFCLADRGATIAETSTTLLFWILVLEAVSTKCTQKPSVPPNPAGLADSDDKHVRAVNHDSQPSQPSLGPDQVRGARKRDRPEIFRGATIAEFENRGATIGQKKIVAPRSGVWG